jgi:X-Pro dipeptidyl-peptidase
VFSMADAISEKVWVEVKTDTDHDGDNDMVGVSIDRPLTDAKVATILTASPYWQCCQDVPNHPVDIDRLPQEWIIGRGITGGSAPITQVTDPRVRLANETAAALRERYLARGYAIVQSETVGTASSDGCPTSGDRSEMLSVKAVIDWLAGRGVAYDEDGDEVSATWSTGKVGMIGVSYNGTLPEMVATSGVKGLETIVPISAISSWYDYYRANGLVVAPGTYQGEDTDVLARFVISDAQKAECESSMVGLDMAQDRGTGDWTTFWKRRDYVRAADKVHASVFIVHGLNDWNVKTQNVEQFWNVLAKNDIPRKIWWHQGGHGGPAGDTSYELPDGTITNYTDTVNRWMDHWLYDVDNGAEDEPMAVVEREDSLYRTYNSWPDSKVEDRTYELSSIGSGTGALGMTDAPAAARQSFVDDGRNQRAEALVQQPDEANPNRLAYVTDDLSEDTRFSGIVSVDLSMSVDSRRDANVTALLVDYGPTGTASIVTRGWMDPQNRNSLSKSESLKRGQLYGLKFGMQPDDYVFAEGHRIGLVVISTDFDYTLRPEPGTKLTLDPRASTITLPVVGG